MKSVSGLRLFYPAVILYPRLCDETLILLHGSCHSVPVFMAAAKVFLCSWQLPRCSSVHDNSQSVPRLPDSVKPSVFSYPGLFLIIDDPAKIRLQARSADQSAVDVRLRKQLIAIRFRSPRSARKRLPWKLPVPQSRSEGLT